MRLKHEVDAHWRCVFSNGARGEAEEQAPCIRTKAHRADDLIFAHVTVTSAIWAVANTHELPTDGGGTIGHEVLCTRIQGRDC